MRTITKRTYQILQELIYRGFKYYCMNSIPRTPALFKVEPKKFDGQWRVYDRRDSINDDMSTIELICEECFNQDLKDIDFNSGAISLISLVRNSIIKEEIKEI